MTEEKREELLKFPCDFPIKVMGINTPEFPQSVANIVREIVRTYDGSIAGVDISKNGRYAGVTVRFVAESREQVESVHQALKGNPLVKVVI